MKLGTAMLNGRPTLVAAMEDGLVELRSHALPQTLLGVLQAGEAALVECARLVALAAQPGSPRLGPATIMAPFLPGKILGVGRNYADHAKEVGGPKLTAPRIFLKPSSSVVGPGAAVRIPPAVTKPDWEAELAVVIGRPAWQVPEGRALDHVAGYTVLNDVSAREFQFDQPLAMTSFAKGLDGFCPMGPWLVTADAVGEPWDLEVTCHLNGEEVQRGNTHDLIFSVPALIAYLSRYMELQPGDVIATGTPAGSGHFRTPPRYLKSGDQLRLEVARVGILEHSIA
jgi:2-keto-4-pentenoate hydratase/2-oxohepta-3-ene-1,7-dioic acid hydratase in catechol pathway